MNLNHLDTILGLIHEAEGPVTGAPVIYLPGSHGDPSLIGEARRILRRDVRLLAVTYPRAESWTLEDYSDALEDLMGVLDVDSAHLIGESFGGLIGWEFGLTLPRRIRSLLLVGGFCRPVAGPRIEFARHALAHLPSAILERGANLFGSGGAVLEDDLLIDWPGGAYVASQNSRPRRAAANRLSILSQSDFSASLGAVRFQVRYVGGGGDTMIPVRREAALMAARLPFRCGFESEIVPGAPHGVLASHAERVCERLTGWIKEIESVRDEKR